MNRSPVVATGTRQFHKSTRRNRCRRTTTTTRAGIGAIPAGLSAGSCRVRSCRRSVSALRAALCPTQTNRPNFGVETRLLLVTPADQAWVRRTACVPAEFGRFAALAAKMLLIIAEQLYYVAYAPALDSNSICPERVFQSSRPIAGVAAGANRVGLFSRPFTCGSKPSRGSTQQDGFEPHVKGRLK